MYKINILLKRFIRNKENYISVILFIILYLTLLIVLNFIINYLNIIKDAENGDETFRFVLVNTAPNDQLGDMETYRDKIMDINHVVDYYNSKNSLINVQSNDLKLYGYDGSFGLIYGANTTIPEVKYGNNIKNENEIICPINFVPDDTIDDKKTSFNKDELINKNISININSSTYNLKIVGLYDNTKNFKDKNLCYITPSDFNILLNAENQEDGNEYNSYVVVIDELKNKNDVIKELYNLNLSVTPYAYVDDSLIKSLYIISILVTISVIIMVLIITIIYTKNYILKRLNYIKLLLAIGYKESDIKNNLLFYISIINIISLFISIILLPIIHKILLSTILIEIKNFNITGKIYYILYLISFIIIEIIIIISALLESKKILKKNIIELNN